MGFVPSISPMASTIQNPAPILFVARSSSTVNGVPAAAPSSEPTPIGVAPVTSYSVSLTVTVSPAVDTVVGLSAVPTVQVIRFFQGRTS